MRHKRWLLSVTNVTNKKNSQVNNYSFLLDIGAHTHSTHIFLLKLLLWPSWKASPDRDGVVGAGGKLVVMINYQSWVPAKEQPAGRLPPQLLWGRGGWGLGIGGGGEFILGPFLRFSGPVKRVTMTQSCEMSNLLHGGILQTKFYPNFYPNLPIFLNGYIHHIRDISQLCHDTCFSLFWILGERCCQCKRSP